MRLRLIIQSGSLTGQQFELEQGSLQLGRGQDCSLRFNSAQDPGVSTHHAIIEAEPDGFYVTDQQSTNGTFVNGNYIKRTLLRAGDVIQLGGHGPRMRVMVESGLQMPRAYEGQFAP